MDRSEFDYLIIGGGSAGSVVAGRLSENPSVSVGLLEAGGAGKSWLVRVPAAFVAMLPTKINNWAFETVPQVGLNGRRGYQPRGKCLGGSSAINAMVYVRGDRWDYDHWAALGNEGWSYRDVLPYFRRSENNESIDDDFHGRGGPLNVADQRSDSPMQRLYLDAMAQAGLGFNGDFNGANQEGVGIFQVTQKGGQRCSAAHAFLHPFIGVRANLDVRTGVAVNRILFEGRRAVGIEYVRNGSKHRLTARREVILCAGALQSPQLLLLSGIGPARQLRTHGIEVVRDLPGVGENLQDHPDFAFVYRARSLDTYGLSVGGGRRLLREIARYRRVRRGMVASNIVEVGGFLRTDPGLPAPDIQVGLVAAILDNHGRTPHFGHGYSSHVILLRPQSRGRVTLRSPDPSQPPSIDPAFLEHPADVEVMVKGFKLVRRLNDVPLLADMRHGDMFTSRVGSDDEIRAVLRDRVDSIYHPVGTCKMGCDPMAVVDSELRVHGVDGLRVVDASIMPTLVGGNTNAPTIMIAEKAVDLILSDGVGGGAARAEAMVH